MEGEPIEIWQARQREYEDSKPENVRKRKIQDAIRQKMKKAEVVENADTSNNGEMV